MTPVSKKAKFIEPGIISYDDSNMGTVFVSREALDRMGPTFKGAPVIFVPEHHNDADKETAFNFDDVGSNPPSGIVTSAPYWGDDGWQYVDMIIWDEQAIKAIDKGFSVSCSYEVDEVAEGGEWHQIPYDEEVVNGHYNHMAIVPRPRYEGSRILANSKGGTMALFGIGKPKNEAPAPAAKPEVKPENACGDNKPQMLNAEDTTVDVNGTPVPLYELIEAFKMKKGAGDTPATLAPEDTVEVEGFGQVTVADLIANFAGEGSGEGEALENAEPPQDTQAAPSVDEKKQLSNAAKKPAPRVVNQALKNAASKADPLADIPRNMDTLENRIKRGNERYSLPVKQGGK